MLDNKYKILSKIGEGGSSQVFLVVDEEFNQFAAKLMVNNNQCTKEQVEFSLSKENILMELFGAHPNILKCYAHILVSLQTEFGVCEVMYNITEFAENRSLSYFVRNTGAFEEDICMFYLRQLASAVSFLHENRVAHCDIKCDNILLDSNFNLKLADFGSSEVIKRNSGLLNHRKGTKHYMAPEVDDFSLKTPYDGKKADVFALGVTMYMMLFGCYPSHQDYGNFGFDLLKCKEDVDVYTLIQLMINEDPENRPDMKEVLDYCDYWLSNKTIISPDEIFIEMEKRKEFILNLNNN